MLEDKEYLKKYFKSRKNKDGPKLFLSKIDYSINKNNILSYIQNRIITPKHKHPLVYCKCYIENNNELIHRTWTCKECNQNYDIDIPNFFCTVCNYYLCQKCFLRYKVKEIKVVNDDINNNLCKGNHKLEKIYFCNEDYSYCSCCGNGYQNAHFKYCCLCNTSLCQQCYEKLNK